VITPPADMISTVRAITHDLRLSYSARVVAIWVATRAADALHFTIDDVARELRMSETTTRDAINRVIDAGYAYRTESGRYLPAPVKEASQ
jgi:predicted transcriptional regulator of viral defense system